MADHAEELTPESRLRLSGGRYEESGFPIEGLPELIQYERLVIDVAKALWLRNHENRRRVPKGFASAIALRLQGVAPGSVIPVLTAQAPSDALPDLVPESIVLAAQQVVDDAFAEIISSNRLPEDFPHGLEGHFLRLGRTLQAGEALEFGQPQLTKRARYTQHVRQRFLSTNQSLEYPLEGVVVGRVTALDTNQLSLTVTLVDGSNIPAVYRDRALTADFASALGSVASAQIVRLECTQILTGDAIARVEDITAVEPFFSIEDLPSRNDLLDLLSLSRGWLDGEGESPDTSAVEQARDFLQAAHAVQLPTPAVVPRLDGSVLVQWIDETTVWSALLTGASPIEVDYLAVEADRGGSKMATSIDAAVRFFTEGQR